MKRKPENNRCRDIEIIFAARTKASPIAHVKGKASLKKKRKKKKEWRERERKISDPNSTKLSSLARHRSARFTRYQHRFYPAQLLPGILPRVPAAITPLLATENRSLVVPVPRKTMADKRLYECYRRISRDGACPRCARCWTRLPFCPQRNTFPKDAERRALAKTE